MDTTFDITLTGSDGPIEGIATKINYDNADAYEFRSTDGTLHLIIAKRDGEWHRIGGTDPYFSGWADELAEQVTK